MASENKRTLMTLYSSGSDIYSHQVRIVLAEKAVHFESKTVDAVYLPNELKNLNPYQTLPILIDRDLALYEGKIIMEYLEQSLLVYLYLLFKQNPNIYDLIHFFPHNIK